MEAVLPRIRSKRRRRKPPGPAFWWALFLLMLYTFGAIFWMGAAIYHIRVEHYANAGPSGFLAVSYCFIARNVYWREFKRELDAWLDGED